MTAAGVGTLATALSRGSTADEVIRIAGPVATAAGCKALVEALIDGDSGQLEIETPSGTTEEEVTLPELTAPPPTEAPTNVLDCLKYDIQFLFDLCVDGTIAPPAA